MVLCNSFVTPVAYSRYCTFVGVHCLYMVLTKLKVWYVCSRWSVVRQHIEYET
jgi:hypothetical protein